MSANRVVIRPQKRNFVVPHFSQVCDGLLHGHHGLKVILERKLFDQFVKAAHYLLVSKVHIRIEVLKPQFWLGSLVLADETLHRQCEILHYLCHIPLLPQA